MTMIPGPLTRIRKGEPSPLKPEPIQKVKPPKAAAVAPKRKPAKALKKPMGILTPPIMETPMPTEIGAACVWIGQRLARQVAKIAVAPHVHRVAQTTKIDPRRMDIAHVWAPMFSVYSDDPESKRARKVFWVCYERASWLFENVVDVAHQEAMGDVVTAFEVELDWLLHAAAIESENKGTF